MTDVLSPTAARRALPAADLHPLVPGRAGRRPAHALDPRAGADGRRRRCWRSRFQGLVVFALELPTSGFADAFGRRPVLVASAVVNVVACVVLMLADSFWTFALAAALQGDLPCAGLRPARGVVRRHRPRHRARRRRRPDAGRPGHRARRLDRCSGPCSRAASSPGTRCPTESALLLPMLCWAALNVVHLVAVVALLARAAYPRRRHRRAAGGGVGPRGAGRGPRRAAAPAAATGCCSGWSWSRSSGRPAWWSSRSSSRSGSPSSSAARSRPAP